VLYGRAPVPTDEEISNVSPKANRSYLTPGPWVLDLFTKTHVRLYEASGGALGATLYQLGERGTSLLRRMNALVLTTKGRKTGLERKVPLPFFQYDDRVFVIASNAGRDKNPAWFLNIVATPDVVVTIGPATLKARAKPLEGAVYEAMWKRHVETWPSWSVYNAGTTRRIPMDELVLGG
jgi:proline iminopeptidase